ncbi:5-formyltetrahydrofolate cyclo-ligase [Ekhidna lutea]|uniref:5-formyltetrahydrofolate cyclo-ligase n=1 Tax=Ekhidna lutea TaxID=447679 RepID=A0A239EZA3_EKHLU|nr:5-formyltetrahydrofolate cyclo-ligase [Ekhidna lutea]SNS49959.1 5-formyltetrahydrofolate cyclo-ligase [Ekhidna lutea]
MLSKSHIRKVILQYRMLLDKVLYDQRNKLLCESALTFIEERKINKLHTFLSIDKNNEPDVSNSFQSMWGKNIEIVVSRTNFQKRTMDHFTLEANTALVTNNKGIPEPQDAEETKIDDLDVIFVPLLTCDKNGFRIGYGGGYYDRLLAETKALKVGLSLSPPVDNIRQKEDWDIPLDYLITPFKTYNYG